MNLPKNWTASMMVRRKPDLICAHHVFCLALFGISLTNPLPGGLFAECHYLFCPDFPPGGKGGVDKTLSTRLPY